MPSASPRRAVPFALTLLLAAGMLAVGTPAPVRAQMDTSSLLGPLHFRHIGPVGNRVASVAGVADDDQIYYVGAASGGLWKTEDAGLTWRALMDDQPVNAIGALEVAPSDPNVIWAGTGEPHIRSNVSIGNGVYRSTDGGENWSHVGLDATGRISDIAVHPDDPDTAYVAALGHAHAPQPERGIYRTTDGGASWEHVLFVDENTGASDIEMDPNNPRILFAGMWQVSVNTWNRESGGPSSAIHMSRDGGDTWERLQGRGLPGLPIGKIDVCMTPSDSKRVYALIETGDGVPWHEADTEAGELWRSDDGAGSWRLVNSNRNLTGRSAYYNNCFVAPDDPNEAYFLTSSFAYTLDGGATTTESSGFFGGGDATYMQAPGGDHHDMWIDPTNADRMIVGHDQGISISENRGKGWNRIQLPIAQMYHVTADTAVPYFVYGNRQDGPSFRGPSNSRTGGFFGGGITRGLWKPVGGGESGFATPDPTDPDVIWSSASGSGAVGGIVVRYRESIGQFRQTEVWPESTIGWAAEELKYRFQWTFPLLISPHDNETVYVTSQVVHRTRNRGQSWDVISPDLTTNDKTRQGISGGLTPDNIGVEYCCVIYAFDESPIQQGVFWAGSNDGLVHMSRDDGANWTNVTGNIPDLPPDGVVRAIQASKRAAAKAYLTVERHQVGDFAAYVYKTEDYGASWTKITNGIADSVLSYTRHIEEDPVREGLLYLGTENALYASWDDGGNWHSLMTDLPSAPVYGIVVQEHFNDLVVGTYGRGFWILDDLGPLQQLDADMVAALTGGDAAGSGIALFEPRDAYRFHSVTSSFSLTADPTTGENPQYGAAISYWIGEGPSEEGEDDSATEVSIRIENQAGETVRTLSGIANPGINRMWWNLRGEPATPLRLRTKPQFADWLTLGPERVREIEGGAAILQLPGSYTVVLEAGESEHRQPLTVIKDPYSEGAAGDIAAQIATLEEIRGDIDTVAGMINRVEWVRRQLIDLQQVLADSEDSEELATATDELLGTLTSVQGSLRQLRLTGTGQDGVRWPVRLHGKLTYLFSGVATADFPPTDQALEVQAVLEQELRDLAAELERVIDTDVEAFNARLRERGLGPVVIGVR